MSEYIPFPESESLLARKPYATALGHERLDKPRSGVWKCKLKTTAPLCLKSYFTGPIGERISLPAASIRGMVRNTVEILGAGCARFHDGPIAATVMPCPDNAGCICCRLFGTTTWQGKVRFADTNVAPVKRIWMHLPPGGRDGLPPTGSGWCIFPAIPLRAKTAEPNHGAVRCIEAGAEFPFEVHYLNLEDDERAILQFALSLTRPPDTQLCHMLGYAKGLGLGRCTIEIVNSPRHSPVIDTWLSQPSFTRLRELRRFVP